MSRSDGSRTAELAYLLWEKQGRPENTSAQNWLEAEYFARSLATAGRDEDEADLRMRGLGPLTQGESLPRNEDKRQTKNSSGTSEIEKPRQGVRAPSVIASCFAGTAMVIAVGMLFSFIRKKG